MINGFMGGSLHVLCCVCFKAADVTLRRLQACHERLIGCDSIRCVAGKHSQFNALRLFEELITLGRKYLIIQGKISEALTEGNSYDSFFVVTKPTIMNL